MTDYKKLKKIIDDIEPMLQHPTLTNGTLFKSWHNRADLFVERRFGSDSPEYKKFKEISFYEIDIAEINGCSPMGDHFAECRKGLKIAKELLTDFLNDIEDENISSAPITQYNYTKLFIVHGHDGKLKESVARIIEKQDNIEAIILSEKANQGKTIIEKIEKYSDVGGAICLFTADDIGKGKNEQNEQPRARQNVVLETGYFMGKLGRDHIVILADKGIEMPSDLSGIVYTDTANWKFELLQELHAMGYNIDMNKLLC